MITDAQLLTLDHMGFIPGPGEEEEAFLSRVAKAKEHFEKGQWIPASHWDWTRECLDQMFHVKPLYICAFYSNRGLAPWQGAASWIKGRSLHSIQLRKGLKKGSYLGLYEREEILAHEAVHAARSGFDENRSEEFFAYMTSEKRWRQVLGPIVQRPWEVWPFFLMVLAGLIWPFVFWGVSFWSGIGFFRLIRQHGRLRRASQRILEKTGDARKARAVLFRLTDREIEALSKGEDMEAYGKKQTDLRWRVLRHYFSIPNATGL